MSSAMNLTKLLCPRGELLDDSYRFQMVVTGEMTRDLFLASRT